MTGCGISIGEPDLGPSTHEFRRNIPVRSTDGAMGVQTFCIDRQGRLIALVAQSKRFDASQDRGRSEVHVLDGDGQPVTNWKVDFHAQSINVDPEDSVYVAGNATVAKYSSDGKLLKKVVLPHVKQLLDDTTTLRKQAEKEHAEQAGTNAAMIEKYRERIEKLEAKSEDKRTKSEKKMLQQLHKSLARLEEESPENTSVAVEETLNDLTGRLRVINSIAISPQDIFIVCGETQGYGYALWRMDRDFQNPTQIKSQMRGCCGQMDVQVQGNDILIAENCNHAFGRYDRDGNKLGTSSGAAKLFGGCCNPMNVCSGAHGEIYTAESEGIIKRFSASGEFETVIGQQRLSGGCKNVALAAAPDGQRVYFCDMPGSQIIVLTQKSGEAQ